MLFFLTFFCVNLQHLSFASTHDGTQAHAAAALINFAEGSSRNVLAPYLEMILSNLAQLLTSKSVGCGFV